MTQATAVGCSTSTLELVDMGALAAATMQLLNGRLPQTIELSHRLRISYPGLWARADEPQLRTLLMALCEDAGHFLQNSGALTVTTDAIELSTAFCHAHPWARPGHFVRLIVSAKDAGDHALAVFSGEQLARAAELADSHSGFLELEKGDHALAIYLPRAHPESDDDVAGNAASSESPAIRSGNETFPSQAGQARETILIAEDEKLVRRSIKSILERAGYRVLAADHGDHALELYHQHAGAIDLAVLDVIMPRLSGPDVFLAMRKDGARFPVVFCTAYATSGLERKLDEVPAVIAKPFDAKTLLERVRCSLDAAARAAKQA
jgi:CheY-like chemotaxis protein